MLSIPQTLSPANLEKAIRSASGGKKAAFDPKELTNALKQLEKLSAAVDASLFDQTEADTAEAARQRLAALEAGPLKAAQAAAAQATKVAQLGAKAQSALKSDKSVDAKTVGAVAEVAGDARGYASDLMKAAQSAQAELKALMARLLASEKKGAQKDARKDADSKKQQDEEDAEEADHEKDLAKVGAQVATAMKLARTAGTAKPMKFMIGVLKKQVFVYVAKATSGSTVARIKRLMEAGAQSVTIYRGECVFENKAHTFIGVNIPTGGFAMRMQKALLELTNKKYKIRVRRPTGETDEAAGDDDDDADADDALAQATKQGGKDAAQAAAVLERHKKLKPALDQILSAGGPMVGAARAAVAAFESKVGSKKFDEALKALDQIENGVLKEARALADAKTKAEKEIKDRLNSLLPDIRKLISAGGSAADDVKKRLQKVQDATRDAARSTAKDAYALAQREFKQLQEAVESTPAGKGVADAARGAAKEIDNARAELERKRAEAQKNIAKITDAAKRAEVSALMKTLEAAQKAAEKVVDAKRQAEAIEKIIKQVEKASEKAIDYAVDKAAKGVDKAAKGIGKVAGKVAETARKAAAPVVSAAERARFNARFGALVAKVKELATTGASDADKLRREILEAGKQATDAAGLAKALQKVGELEKKVQQSAAQAAMAQGKQAIDAAAAKAESFTFSVGGRQLKGVTRDEAMTAVTAEFRKVESSLEAGFNRHCEDMKVQRDEPFAAWVSEGVSKLFKGGEAMPELEIWDPARNLLLDARKAMKKGDLKACAAMLPQIEAATRKGLSRIGRYENKTQEAAEDTVAALRKGEDLGTMAASEIGKKVGGKAGGVAAGGAYASALEAVEQASDIFFGGGKKEFNKGAIAKRGINEVVSGIVSELLSGAMANQFKKMFGSYIGKSLGAEALKDLGGALGLNGPMPRDFLMTHGQKYLAEFLAEMGLVPLKTALAKVIERVGEEKGPSLAEIGESVIEEMRKGGIEKLFFDYLKSKAKG